MQVARGVLCRCTRSSSSSSTVMCRDSGVVERLEMLTEQEVQELAAAQASQRDDFATINPSANHTPLPYSDAPIVSLESSIPGHSMRCRRVLVKSSVVSVNLAASTAKLKYEAVMQELLHKREGAGSSGMAQHNSSNSNSSSKHADHDDANAAAPASPSSANMWPLSVKQVATSPDDVQPHLVQLGAHGAAALVLPDVLAEPLSAFGYVSPSSRPTTAQSSTVAGQQHSSSLEGSGSSASSTSSSSSFSAGSTSSGFGLPSAGIPTLPPRQTSDNSYGLKSPSAVPSSSLLMRGSSGEVRQTLPPPVTLRLITAAVKAALAVAVELQRLHACGLVHKALSPDSILLHAPSGRVQFLDLSNASALAKDRADADSQVSLSNANLWLFASPEASGKANRAIDSRSDIYSLGCLLHMLITGRPPFVASDALELIHMHLARAPPSIMPKHSSPALTPLLKATQAILSKLLQKQAEERYQSAAGLIHDLRLVLSAAASVDAAGLVSRSSQDGITASDVLAGFTAGALDQVSTFVLSQRLYGRVADIEHLRAAYFKVTLLHDGAPEMFFISGCSGVGKTSLVDELHQHILAKHGLFARCKFDLYKRDSSCLLQAFRSLVLQLIVRGAAMWKVRILRAVGQSGRVLTDVLPELTRLIGEQPVVAALGTAETAARFNRVFLDFVACLAVSTSPLVLFVDDLQWADSGSLAMLRSLHGLKSAHLLIIGAYRSNELDDDHLLVKLRQHCENEAPDRTSSTVLGPLRIEDITQLLQDSFRCTAEAALPFAQLLAVRTNANPFHVSQLLKSYHDTGLMRFNFEKGEWTWDLAAMQRSPVQADVADFICERMQTLSADAQQLLQYASCSGHRVSVHSLYLITQMPLGRLSRGALELEQAGMLLCVEHARDLLLLAQMHGDGSNAEEGVSTAVASLSVNANPSGQPSLAPSFLNRLDSIILQFAHDKIQAAAYKLIPPSKLSGIHYVIASQLLASYEGDELEEWAMDIVSHINAAGVSAYCGDSSDREPSDGDAQWLAFFEQPGMVSRVFSLECIAAKQAKGSTAFDSAVQYVTFGLRVLDRAAGALAAAPAASAPSVDLPPNAAVDFFRISEACWRMWQAQCVQAYLELCQSMFMLAQYKGVVACTEYVLSHLTGISARMLFFSISCQSYSQQQMMPAVIDVGIGYLKELGIELFKAMTPELEAWCTAVPDIEDESTFSQHPVLGQEEMNDPQDNVAMQVMVELFPATYVMQDPRYINNILTMLDHTRRKGANPDAATAFATLAVTWFDRNNYSLTFAMGSVGQLLLARFGEAGRPAAPRSSAVFLGLVHPWKKPMRKTLQRELIAIDDAIAQADIAWVGWMLCHLAWLPMLAGLTFTQCVERHTLQVAYLKRMNFDVPLAIMSPFFQLEQDMVNGKEKTAVTPNEQGVAVIKASEAVSDGLRALLMRRSAEMQTATTRMKESEAGVASLPPYAFGHYVQVLSLLTTCPRYSVPPFQNTLDAAMDPTAFMPTQRPADYNDVDVEARLKEADRLIAKMAVYAKYNPHDHLHKFQLVKAERHRAAAFSHLAQFDGTFAMHQMYRAAVAGALASSQPLDAAIATELYGRFAMDAHLHGAASTHLARAYVLYEATGANLKLAQLRAEFGESISSSTPSPATGESQLLQHPALAPQPSTLTQSVGVTLSSVQLATLPHGQDHSLAYLSSYSSSSGAFESSLSGVEDAPGTEGSVKPVVSPESTSNTTASAATRPPAPSPDFSSASMGNTAMPWQGDALSVLKATSQFATEKNQTRLLSKLMRIVLETAGATRGVLVLEDADKNWCVELGGSVEAESEPAATPIDESVPGDEYPLMGPHRVIPEGPVVDVHGPASCSSESGLETSLAGSTTSSGSRKLRINKHAGIVSVESALPASVFNYVLDSMEVVAVSLSEVNKQAGETTFAAFAQDPYFATHQPKALLCMPVLRQGAVFGVLYLENDYRTAAFTSSHIQLLQLLCSQAALSIDNARLYNVLSETNLSLEAQVQSRTAELEEKNRQLVSAKEAAEQATKIKADFLSNMSHEIRTPMNAVLGIGRLLADTQLNLEQQQYVTMINNSGHLLLTIINDILDYSKIEAGQLTLNFSRQNVGDVVEAAVLLCYDMAVSKGLSLSWFVDPALPSALMIDSTRLQQVLLNLLSNAIKFTKKGGVKLEVSGQLLPPSADPPGRVAAGSPQAPRRGSVATQSPVPTPSSLVSPPPAPQQWRVRCVVQDSGIGISKEALSKLFRSFSQVQHVSGEYGGTGLGLVISKRLVQAMGDGEIQVESESGRGSSFGFHIIATVPLLSELSASDSAFPSMSSSPATAPRTVSTVSSSRDSTPTSAFRSLRGLSLAQTSNNLHGLSPSDEVVLSQVKLLFIGNVELAQLWLRVYEYYRMQVATVCSMEAARVYLTTLVKEDALGTSPVPSPKGSSVPSPRLQDRLVLFIDLDIPGLSEEACSEQLLSIVPLRVLYLFTKSHLSLGQAAALPGAEFLRETPRHDATTPVPTQYPTSSPALSEGTTVTTLSTSEVISTTVAASAVHEPIPGVQQSVEAYSMPQRGLRKPFSIRALLQALLGLLVEAPLQMAPRPFVRAQPSAEDATGSSDNRSQSHANAQLSISVRSARQNSNGDDYIDNELLSNRSTVSTPAKKIPNLAAQYPLRILLAEDNLINQKMMVMLHRKLGYEIAVAGNGNEALHMLEQEARRGPGHEFECILMDASMDVMDGMECTRVIRAQQMPTRVRPFIIAQTANVTEEYRERCLQSGMDLFLSKPIAVESLQRALQQAYRAVNTAAEP